MRPCSKVIIKFLRVMQRKNYIGDFEIIDDRRGGKIVIELLGRLNKCGVISPRMDISLNVNYAFNTRISRKLSEISSHQDNSAASSSLQPTESWTMKKLEEKIQEENYLDSSTR